jgi:uncharacterized protein
VYDLRGPTRVLTLVIALAGASPAAGDCPHDPALTPLARLANLQERAPPVGSRITTAGTVTGVFPGRNGLNGFFIQQDGNDGAAGLFVYAPAFTAAHWARVTPGTRIRVRARAGEYRGRPQLQDVSDVRACGRGRLPPAAALRLPADREALEALHGMLVRFPQPLTVTGNDTLGDYGSLDLSAGGRLFRHPVPDDRLHRIILDDGSYRANPEPVPYLDAQGTRRAGDTVEALTGILVHAFDEWRIHPLMAPRFRNSNPRPEAPEPPAGVRVATFNLENYFLSPGERGARDDGALARQRGKLLAALEGQDADLLALVEVENRREALVDLVQRLNDRLPEAGRYRLLDGPEDSGSDAIMVALVYRPRTLAALAAARSDDHDVHKRPPVLAPFRDRKSGQRFLAAAVHFKSKAACPAEGDVDLGQGCWNLLRTAQARALLQAVSDEAERHAIEHVVLAGDFNSYPREDPVRVLEQSGYRNPVADHLPPQRRYTYVFHGEAGMLDYIFASPSLAGRVTGAGVWHINADEPPFLSYDGRRGRAGHGLKEPWRSSDHDPVIIGIGF